MTDFMKVARSEILAEDAEAVEKRVRARAAELARKAEIASATVVIPNTAAELETVLADMRGRHTALLERRRKSERHGAPALSAAADSACDRLGQNIVDYEARLRQLQRVAS